MKKQILLFVLALLPMLANADAVEISGIYYNFNSYDKTAEVTKNPNKYSGEVVIPEKVAYERVEYSVTSISYQAFYDCSNLTSITIPNSMKSIGEWAFRGCSDLTSVTIPNSVTSIGDDAFYGCRNLQNIKVPVTDYSAFCSNQIVHLINDKIRIPVLLIDKDGNEIKDCVIPDNVTSIGSYAFEGCIGLTSITIPNSVASIGASAFRGCSGLTSVTILPNSVTSIGSGAFAYCTNLTSVTLPCSVTGIGNNAFERCSNLQNIKVIVTDYSAFCSNQIVNNISNPIYFVGKPVLLVDKDGNEIKEYVIPDNVTSISSYAFYGCIGLTSVTIGNSVTNIGQWAFSDCISLTSISIGNNVSSIEKYAFQDCSSLTSVIIPTNVTSIGEKAFERCGALSSVYIHGTPAVGNWAFGNAESIILLNDNYTSSLGNAFYNSKLYVHKGSKTLLNLWKSFDNIYEIGTTNRLYRPSIYSVVSTQTTLKFSINGFYNEYTYTFENKKIDVNRVELVGLRPDQGFTNSLKVSLGDYYYNVPYSNLRTQPVSPAIKLISTTPTSFIGEISYKEGDAVIASEVVKMNNVVLDNSLINDKTFRIKGLNPNTSRTIDYIVTVKYGEDLQYTYSYSTSKTIKTDYLQMTTQQPKVTSMGNAIVAAETNLEDEDLNVGFEWRRTDWNNDFASNTGKAVLYEGKIEGYIRNLNTNYLWKYRPYYLSNSGTYYYGDWVGLDPTNVSYFEPTIHTYAYVTIDGNTALVKGYALEGTNDVVVQGFKYWKSSVGAPRRASLSSVPASAITVIVSGQVMTTTLSDLDYGTTYNYAAFVTTSEGETFYGEEQSFTTENAPTNIKETDSFVKDEVIRIVGYYDLNGRQLGTPARGVNIVRYSDGTSRKVVIK